MKSFSQLYKERVRYTPVPTGLSPVYQDKTIGETFAKLDESGPLFSTLADIVAPGYLAGIILGFVLFAGDK